MSIVPHHKTYTQSDIDRVACLLNKASRNRDGFIASCPTHDDRSPSFQFWLDEDGRFASKCYAGCEYKDTIKAIEDLLDSGKSSSFVPSSRPSLVSKDSRGLTHRQRLIFEEEARYIQSGDPAHRYLTETRKIPLQAIPSDLRYHPNLDYWIVENDVPKSIGQFDAMLAGIRDVNGKLIGYQRYYLTFNGRKIKEERPELTNRKLTGSMTGGAVKLYQPKEVLLIGEGLETGLATSVIFDLPCWASISSTNLSKVQIPDRVKEVHICVDSDKAGIKASRKLAGRLLGEGKKVLYREVPNSLGVNDWADVLEIIEK